MMTLNREPDYAERYELPVERLFGAFPQLVNREMLDRIGLCADAVVRCVSSRGLPRRLFDKEGRPTTIVHDYDLAKGRVYEAAEDSYYPSPEMHEDGASLLLTAIDELR